MAGSSSIGPGAPGAVGAPAAGTGVGVVEGDPEELHEAGAGGLVGDHGLRLGVAGGLDARRPLAVVLPGRAGPDDAAGDPFDHTVDVEDLEQRLEPGPAEVHHRFQGRQARGRGPVVAHRGQDPLDESLGRQADGREPVPDPLVLGAGEQPRLRPGDGTPGPADLLVVGDRRRRRPRW